MAPSSYQVLYNFGGTPDGAYPSASLIEVRGTLHGTTPRGGTFRRSDGTVFSISASGAEQVLYSFGRPHRGHGPVGLINIGGMLYGTTSGGGRHGDGTVFSITTSGRERVLHSFDYNGGSNSDGKSPSASLIDVGGTLYGTTWYGGSGGCGAGAGCGTVFSITANSTETVLHRFTGPDGANPSASLIDVKGTLYGTTTGGGKFDDAGTVFSISRSGTEKVLHSFGRGSDGVYPEADLIDVNGVLYGTTRTGGAISCGSTFGGCGTVFSVSTTGAEKVLHSFGGQADGFWPRAGLTAINDTLYGTTEYGGTYDITAGTVFSISTTGTQKVLHSFGNGSDGYLPVAGLIDVNGTLYGSTAQGGTHGYGTVFALTP